MDLKSVLTEVGSWPPEDRLLLIEQIWEGLTPNDEPFELSEAQKTDLRRRLEANRRNPDAGSPWSEVKARLLGQTG